MQIHPNERPCPPKAVPAADDVATCMRRRGFWNRRCGLPIKPQDTWEELQYLLCEEHYESRDILAFHDPDLDVYR